MVLLVMVISMYGESVGGKYGHTSLLKRLTDFIVPIGISPDQMIRQ
jgi:hypothetical protein